MRPIRLATLLLGASILLGAGNSSASRARADGREEPSCGLESVPLTAPSDWEVDVVPYAWAPWVNGWQTVKGRSVDVHANQIQALEHLQQVPVMLYSEARRGRVGAYCDIIYGNVGFDESAVRTHPTRTLSAALGLDALAFIGEVGGVLEVAEWESGGGSTSIDVLGGARVWHQEADLKLALTDTLDVHHLVITKNYAIAQSGSINWVDPLVGARLRRRLAAGGEIYLRGDVGGFDAGSQFTWNLTTAYAFELCSAGTATYTGLIGYRLLDVDYTRGNGYSQYTFDVLMQGPLLGLSIGF